MPIVERKLEGISVTLAILLAVEAGQMSKKRASKLLCVAERNLDKLRDDYVATAVDYGNASDNKGRVPVIPTKSLA